ncbi:MAG: dTMP kinase [Thaumarchaeota archaeon]|jgi:dTMP kinase|nr:dTMP kinase [Candidatus Geocrenenecus arthurdayi]
MMGNEGFFIAIEGIDGSGKTTHSRRLVKWLSKHGLKSLYTREPTDSAIGRMLKKMARQKNVDSRIEALLFAADRLEHLNKVILPYVKKKYVVVSDRYVYSSLAYQTVAIGDPEWVVEINKFAHKPDLTILLDVKPEIGLSRIKKRKTRFEKEDFLQKVRQEYLRLAEKDGLKIIDASKNIEEVFYEIISIVQECLKDKLVNV